MTTISFELPDEAMLSMHVPPAEVTRELRMAAAVKLYELGRLPSVLQRVWRVFLASSFLPSWLITAPTPSA